MRKFTRRGITAAALAAGTAFLLPYLPGKDGPQPDAIAWYDCNVSSKGGAYLPLAPVFQHKHGSPITVEASDGVGDIMLHIAMGIGTNVIINGMNVSSENAGERIAKLESGNVIAGYPTDQSIDGDNVYVKGDEALTIACGNTTAAYIARLMRTH